MKINDLGVAFRKYGRVLSDVDFSALVDKMEEIPLPQAGVDYRAGDDKLEALPQYQEFAGKIWGEMPVQIGICWGFNNKLNAFEYHRNSEVIVAGKGGIVLLLGMQQDIEEDNTYDTSRVEAFLVPEGVAVELYATTLHYAPCGVDGRPFRAAIVLPKGTNHPLEGAHMAEPEDKLLAAKNKWLIGHAEGGCPPGTFIGLKGENVSI